MFKKMDQNNWKIESDGKADNYFVCPSLFAPYFFL